VKKSWERDDPFFAETVAMAKKHGVNVLSDSKVIREGRKVFVYMTSAAPIFSLGSFKVKKGDEVTVVVTNIDAVEDVSHGFCIVNYGINMEISPGATASATFTADKAGVFWYYCTFFCHAMHMEMSGRMLVEA
jgi:nitrous-oxide reductase